MPIKKEARKGYYQANSERLKANTAAWKKANPEKHAAQILKWKQENPDYKLIWRYGINQAQYDVMREKQNFRCAICNTHENDCAKQKLFVDHCHHTGKVRGLLCSRCNTLLGVEENNPGIFVKALHYFTGQ